MTEPTEAPSGTPQSAPTAPPASPTGSAPPATTTPPTPTPGSPAPTDGRPEWMPEKFWQEGKPNTEQLARSYRELERKAFDRREKIKEELRVEQEAERHKDVPGNPGDYIMKKRVGADGQEIVFDENDPAIGFIRHEAHRFNLTHTQFNELLDRWADLDSKRGPDWNTEKTALGENADMRLSRIATWAKGSMTPEAFAFFSTLPASAKMVTLFENIMVLSGQPAFTPKVGPNGEPSFNQSVTDFDLKKMIADPKYWRDKDPAYVEQVRAASRAVAGRR